MKKSYIREVVKQVLDEMNTTAAVGGYLTKNAFSKKGQGKNIATKTAEKLGYRIVQPKKYPHSTKMIDYKKLN